MRVAGIDPGTIKTGIGIVDQDASGQYSLKHVETIATHRHESIAKRLRTIYGALKEVLAIYKPDVAAIESVFFCENFTSAIKIGEARAVAMLAAMDLSIDIEEYMPTRVKSAICGNGRASKQQVQFMVQKMLQIKEPLAADSADALAIAICHLNREGNFSIGPQRRMIKVKG